VLSPRAEGPSVSSPARKGGVFKISLTRGPKDRHSDCVAPSALLLNTRPIPALRPSLLSVGPSGLNCFKYVTVIVNNSTKFLDEKKRLELSGAGMITAL
jgi:hypothetical protein